MLTFAVFTVAHYYFFDPVVQRSKAMVERAKQRFSPVDLQNTVRNLCEQEQYLTNRWVSIEEVPHEISSLCDIKPAFATLSHSGPGNCSLTVVWGGGMRDWGIVISQPGGQLDTNTVRHLSLWSDGVAFFHN
jgi:hypothetical protein